jgi:hypothetical protein
MDPLSSRSSTHLRILSSIHHVNKKIVQQEQQTYY